MKLMINIRKEGLRKFLVVRVKAPMYAHGGLGSHPCSGTLTQTKDSTAKYIFFKEERRD